MIEIICPTLWKSPHIHTMLERYVKNDYVSRIHIMDNGKEFHKHYPNYVSPKIQIHTPSEYNEWMINKSWNLGVEACDDQSLVVIVNDDIIFDTDVFEYVLFNSEHIGILGMHSDNYTTTEKMYEIVDIPQQMHGWGCMIMFDKWNWVPIPDDLKLYYGDTWQFHMNPIPCKAIKGVPMSESNISMTTTQPDLIEQFTEQYKKEIGIFAEMTNGSPLNRGYNTIENLYKEKCDTPSDINEHLPKLREIAERCNHITEFGVRTGVSSVALLASKPHTLISYDVNPFDGFYELNLIKGDTNYQFIQKSVLETTIQETDFLFIDTLHTYDQLKQELEIHASRVRKYIAFHDTELFGTFGEVPDTKGLRYAISEFLQENDEWEVMYDVPNNNGLMILSKTNF